MKALVLEAKNGRSAVLRDDGVFDRIEGEYPVGKSIEFKSSDEAKILAFTPRKARIAVAAAATALVVGLGSGAAIISNQNIAESYVTIDVKPSIEYALNRENMVIEAIPLNKDAEAITEELNSNGSLKGASISDALEKTMELLKDKGYVTEGGDDIVVSVTSKEAGKTEELRSSAESAITSAAGSDAKVYVLTASESDREAAKKAGMSTGLYEMEKQSVRENADRRTDRPASSGDSKVTDSASGTSTADQTAAGATSASSARPDSSSRTGTAVTDPQASSSGRDRDSKTGTASTIEPTGGSSSDASSAPAGSDATGTVTTPSDGTTGTSAEPTEPGGTGSSVLPGTEPGSGDTTGTAVTPEEENMTGDEDAPAGTE